MSLLLTLLLAAPLATSDLVIEAEDAHLVGVVVDTTRSGFSGTGYVTGFDAPGDSLRFDFEAGAGVYEVRLAVAQQGRVQPYAVWIDGAAARSGSLIGGGAFAERPLGEVWLSEGAHALTVQGGFDVDYLRLVPVVYAPPEAPDVALSDPAATPAAQALFGFLKDQYGRRILSGQQELRELDYIERVTGRVPAIAVGDLMEYSPSRVACYDQRGTYAERLIDWADRRGIISLSWHWNAPTDLIDDDCDTSNNVPGQEWWSGFYTRATTFDVAAALADTTSEAYRLLLRDLDAIAVPLRAFADADVPVLWRPLHEAAGGWFWWGAQGPEPFVELWRLVYDRLVHDHGLHHLIWVYTHEPNAEAWYPGDDVVDVVGRDVYAGDPAATMRSDWEELQALYGDRKLLALSESGTLPDPVVITDFGVWWSWFSLWTREFIRGVDPDHLRRVYASELVLTRDELPDWRSLGLSAEPEPAVADAFAPRLEVYPNPSAGPATLRLDLSAPADVHVEVYDAVGRRVQRLPLGHRPAGVVEVPVGPGAAAGVYFVRVVAGRHTAQRALVVVR